MSNEISVFDIDISYRIVEKDIDFLPRDASAERGDATVSRPSVCPSVRPSVCDV